MLEAEGGSGRLLDAINVTPFADVCLVLLIIFMLVAPYLEPGRDVQMPQALNPDSGKEPEEPTTITVRANGTLFLGTTPVPHGLLRQELSEALRQNSGAQVHLKADRRIAFGEVKRVLADVEGAGSRQVQLLVKHVDSEGRPVSGSLSKDCHKKGGGP